VTTFANLASDLFSCGSMGEAITTAVACVARASPEGSVCASKNGAHQLDGDHRVPGAPVSRQSTKFFLNSVAGHQGGLQDCPLPHVLRLIGCHTYITAN